MVVVSTRHVPADEAARAAFNEAQLAASEYMMNNIEGTKAVFQSTDWEEVTLVHDVQWWESLDSFMLHVDPTNQDMQDILNNWVPKYDHSVPFKGHVFGGWNEELRNVSHILLLLAKQSPHITSYILHLTSLGIAVSKSQFPRSRSMLGEQIS